jgi:uncharacterized protein YidB (DUF937 family)
VHRWCRASVRRQVRSAAGQPKWQAGRREGYWVAGNLLQRFQQSGDGDIINSWLGPGENRSITPDQLHHALGPEAVDTLRA